MESRGLQKGWLESRETTEGLVARVREQGDYRRIGCKG